MTQEIKAGDAAFLKRWEVTRKQGHGRYLLLMGVVSWGIPMFLVMTFALGGPARLTVATVAVNAVIWGLGGLLFGALTWFFSERRYQRLSPPSGTGS